MPLSVKTVRSQLNILRPLVEKCSLETSRKWQNKIGAFGAAINSKKVNIKKQSFENFDSAWIIPADERRSGVIMYIHGGALIFLGAFMLLVEFLLTFTFKLSHFMGWFIYPMVPSVLLGGLLIFFAICRPARESLERKFFI